MRNSDCSRRHFLMGTATALVGSMLFQSPRVQGVVAAQDGTSHNKVVAGSIDELDKPDIVILRNHVPDHQEKIVVTVSDQTRFSRGHFGIVAGLAAFQVGDQVVIEGEWIDNYFAASNVMTMYHHFTGVVHEYSDTQVNTSHGKIYLTPDVWVQTRDGTISKQDQCECLQEVLVEGSPLHALTWFDKEERKHMGLRLTTYGET